MTARPRLESFRIPFSNTSSLWLKNPFFYSDFSAPMFRTAYRVLDTYCISVRDSGMSAGIFSCFILVLKTLKEKKKEKREIKRILTACQSRRRKKERERKDDLMEITNPVRRLRKLFWGGQLKIPCPLIGYLPRKKATVDPKSHLSSFSYMPLISFLTTDIPRSTFIDVLHKIPYFIIV